MTGLVLTVLVIVLLAVVLAVLILSAHSRVQGRDALLRADERGRQE